MKISIITVCYNAQNFIESAITSVLSQTYPNIEYIIVDGNSTDATMSIVNRYTNQISKIISEPDKGIYDAMNKGIACATGDIVGILNADDFYPNNQVIERVVAQFSQHQNTDFVLGSIAFVADQNAPIERVVSSVGFVPHQLKWGWMPPHPAAFVRKDVYDRFGVYKTDYRIAADYEFFIRTLLKQRLNYLTLPDNLVYMRTGGASTSGWESQHIITQEIVKGLHENGYFANYILLLLRLPIKFLKQVMLK